MKIEKFNIVYLTLVFILLAAFSMIKPIPDYDVVGYVGSAKSFELKDKTQLHKFVFEGLQQHRAAEDYKHTVEGHYRKTMSIDPEAYAQQLPYYQIRLLHNVIIYFFDKLGINIFSAPYIASTIAAFAAMFVLTLIFYRRISPCYVITIPFFALTFGVLEISRYSTPDALAFLMVTVSIYLLVENRKLFFYFTPFAVLARTDLILFVFLILAYSFYTRKSTRLFSVVSLILTVILYVAVNRYFDNLGWATVFYFTFIDRVTHPADMNITISFSQYMSVLIPAIKDLLGDHMFTSYTAITVVLVVSYLSHFGMQLTGSSKHETIFALIIISYIYVIAHFILYPAIWPRFFTAQYMFSAISLIYMLSLFHEQRSARNI